MNPLEPDLNPSVMEIPDITSDDMSMDFFDEAIEHAIAHTGLKREVVEFVGRKFLFVLREYMVRGYEVDLKSFALSYRYRKGKMSKLIIPKIAMYLSRLGRISK